MDLPEGVSFDVGGASQEQEESFGQLGMAMAVAIVLVFLVTIATFRSFVQTLILLVSIPFAATGAVMLLLLTGTPLGIPSLISLLKLIGIVVTNAIVPIDLINQLREHGMGLIDGIVHGTRLRLRPILMTAAATVFALVPMSLGLTGGGSLHLPAPGDRRHRRTDLLDGADHDPRARALPPRRRPQGKRGGAQGGEGRGEARSR